MQFNYKLYNQYSEELLNRTISLNEGDKWSDASSGIAALNTIFSRVDNGDDIVQQKEITLFQRLINIVKNFVHYGSEDEEDPNHLNSLSNKINDGTINVDKIRENLERDEKNDYSTNTETRVMGDFSIQVIITNRTVEKCHSHDNENIVNAYTGELRIVNNKTGKNYNINLYWDETLPNDAINKLLNALQETIEIVSEEVAEDIFLENKEYYIFDGKNYADFNAYAGDDKITLAYENKNGESALRSRVLIHETGHNIQCNKEEMEVRDFFQDKKASEKDIIKYLYLTETFMDGNGQEKDPFETLNSVNEFKALGYKSKLDFIIDFRRYKQGEKPKNKNLINFMENSANLDSDTFNALHAYEWTFKHEDNNGFRQGIFISKLKELYTNEKYPSYYALSNGFELFAEYYAYKAVGDRKDLVDDRGAAYLFDSMKASGDPEQLAILEYMDKMIEKIHQKSIEDRVSC